MTIASQYLYTKFSPLQVVNFCGAGKLNLGIKNFCGIQNQKEYWEYVQTQSIWRRLR